jgi:energy-coupling factor transporter ATP-binding protein EcfA2
MRIKRVWAVNFRGLSDIKLTDSHDINVVVGPNAVGKSTLLEAIRLAKSILSPRFPNEAQQALVTIGALSPHFQAIGSSGIDISALANDMTKEVTIGFCLQLSTEELTTVQKAIDQIALILLQNQLAGSGNDGNLALTQFLSSVSGRDRLNAIRSDIIARVSALNESTMFMINLTMDPRSGRITGQEVFDQTVLAFLDRRLSPDKSMLSYFPADRILPQGEQAMQLGTADAQQQLLSHMATPASKYSRVKQTIVQNLISGKNDINLITEEANVILTHLLPGKYLAGIQISPIGALKIMIGDRSSGKTFDIDAMSSGEKGVLMTFLFIRLSLMNGGVVLLDEPELHLNATVQEKILRFIYEHCVMPKSLQVFLCTHSPEIVKEAIGKDYCGLYHLRSGNDLTPVYERDQRETFEIFDRLGHSASEVLFTKGDIYVEGDQDDIIIKSGFDDVLSGFKITSLGGRESAEREMPLLQEQEKKGNLKKLQVFVIDNDGILTKLRNSLLVKIIQWEKRNIENYLIDDDILFDLVTSHANKPIESRGSFPESLKTIALRQIENLSIRDTCGKLLPKSLSVDNKLLGSGPAESIAKELVRRVDRLKDELASFEPEKWKNDFVLTNAEIKLQLEDEWKTDWRDRCDGKKLIDDLYIKYEIALKKTEFKRQIMATMRKEKTSNWRSIDEKITEALS